MFSGAVLINGWLSITSNRWLFIKNPYSDYWPNLPSAALKMNIECRSFMFFSTDHMHGMQIIQCILIKQVECSLNTIFSIFALIHISYMLLSWAMRENWQFCSKIIWLLFSELIQATNYTRPIGQNCLLPNISVSGKFCPICTEWRVFYIHGLAHYHVSTGTYKYRYWCMVHVNPDCPSETGGMIQKIPFTFRVSPFHLFRRWMVNSKKVSFLILVATSSKQQD